MKLGKPSMPAEMLWPLLLSILGWALVSGAIFFTAHAKRNSTTRNQAPVGSGLGK